MSQAIRKIIQTPLDQSSQSEGDLGGFLRDLPQWNRRILILEDEPDIIAAYRQILSGPKAAASGVKSSRVKVVTSAVSSEPSYELVTVSKGEEAIELVKNALTEGRPFAAAFFDVLLGTGIDGIETLRRVHGLDPSIHCVLVTAYQDRNVDDIHAIFGAAFQDRWDYLNKPFSHGEIQQKARNMVSAWNRQRREQHYQEAIQKAHHQLMIAERMSTLGAVARGLGHEFGNLLLQIIGHADLALTRAIPEQMKKSLAVILGAAEKAAEITKNLQTLSVSQDFELKQGNILVPLEQSIDLMHSQFRKAGIEVVTDFKPVSLILVNEGSLSQVFLNILINAVYAVSQSSRKDRKVWVDARESEKYLMVRITDSGDGIPEDVLPKIFDYLFTTKGKQGSGLGLPICRQIVEDFHGGKLTASNESGRGACFTMELLKNHEHR